MGDPGGRARKLCLGEVRLVRLREVCGVAQHQNGLHGPAASATDGERRALRNGRIGHDGQQPEREFYFYKNKAQSKRWARASRFDTDETCHRPPP